MDGQTDRAQFLEHFSRAGGPIRQGFNQVMHCSGEAGSKPFLYDVKQHYTNFNYIVQQSEQPALDRTCSKRAKK